MCCVFSKAPILPDVFYSLSKDLVALVHLLSFLCYQNQWQSWVGKLLDRQQVIQICKLMEDYHFFQAMIFIAIGIIKLFPAKQQISFGMDHLPWCRLTYSFFPSFIYFCNFSSSSHPFLPHVPLPFFPSFISFLLPLSLFTTLSFYLSPSFLLFLLFLPSFSAFFSLPFFPFFFLLSLFPFSSFSLSFLLFLSFLSLFLFLSFLLSLSLLPSSLSLFHSFSIKVYFMLCMCSLLFLKTSFLSTEVGEGDRHEKEKLQEMVGHQTEEEKKPREVEIEKIDGRTDGWCLGCLEVSLER